MIWQYLRHVLAGLAFLVPLTGAVCQSAEATSNTPSLASVVTPSKDVASAAQQLFSDDFDVRLAGLKQLGALTASDNTTALALLRALEEEQLVRVGASVFIQVDNRWVNVGNGATVESVPPDATYPTLNNRLRGELDRLLAQSGLLSDSVATRLQASQSLLDAPDGTDLKVIQLALAKETYAETQRNLALLRDMVGFQSAQANGSLEEQRRFVAAIGESSLRQAESFLKSALTEASDKALRDDIDDALKRIAEKRARGAIANTLFTGISLGSILLLAALGLAISYGLIGVINMAHGEFLMLGAYTTYLVQVFFQTHLPADWLSFYLVFAVPSAFVLCGAFGLLVEWSILRHLYGRPLETLLATFGLSLVMMQAVRVLFGAQNVQVANPSWMSGAISPLQSLLPGLLIPNNRLVIVGFSLAVLCLTWLTLTRTRLGLYIRGTTQNRTMASCVGIATRRVDSLAFALGTGVAGLGGVALSQIGNVGPDLGQAYIIDSFMVVVLGGVGQLAGAVIGAMGLGIASKFAEPVIGAVLAKIAILVLIILFIQKRPSGLFALKGRSGES